MTEWLHIVGVTEGEVPGVLPGRVVIGPRRLLERLTPTPEPSPQGGGEPARHRHSGQIDRARQLRVDATMPERVLWNAMKHIDGVHFRRQVPIGPYFADFACHHPKLVIELDGQTHGTDQAAAHDARRTEFLERAGYRVLRFWNGDITSNLDGVYQSIMSVLAELTAAGAPLPLEGRGGGGGSPTHKLIEWQPETTEASAPLPPEGRGGGGGGPQPKTIEWEPALDRMLAQVETHRGTPTIILASGDPLWFGIGATLLKHLDPAEVNITPAASSFQFAAARLRWPMQHVTTLSLHARPAELIHPHVTPGNRILALTTDATTAPHVAQLLVERRYGRSVLTALENLGGPDERIQSAEALGFSLTIGDFYVLAVDCAADPGAALLPPVPGLPDDAFVSDGQLTKREVRAATLGKLQPYPGALLWDVGAGCGSVAIEWMRAARDAHAIAFEREAERLEMIAVNASRLGVPSLQIEPGDAPDSLAGKPAPDAVFLGGGVADETLFQACWSALRHGGRFVANAVTLEAEQALYARQARLGGDLCRIEVATLDAIGPHRALRPRLPITQWSVTKP